jgi:beta-xylosidase
MYFHGPNTTTHYATSDNLVNWTFGESILNSKQFSPVGAECSYGKCFEHEIPGLGNKYVFLMMNQEGQIRRIRWAYSNDGKTWTAVPKTLVHPDLDYKKIPGTLERPNYTGTFGTPEGNVAAPYLIERNGRYFVLCHGSSGNMFCVEVGESFDMEVHWGIYHRASDCLIDTDVSGNPVAVPRIASPQFIQDDNGKYYLFFEAGSRLGSNIAYAKEDDNDTSLPPQYANVPDVAVYPAMVKSGQFITIETKDPEDLRVEIFNTLGGKLHDSWLNNVSGKIEMPFPAGLYLVKATSRENRTKGTKVIVTN